MVGAANRLDQRAAAPLSGRQLAARGSGGAAALVITFDVADGGRFGPGAQFGEPGEAAAPAGARAAVEVTGVSTGAAVVSICTADGIRQRAAAPPLRPSHEAAGCVSGAAGPSVTHVPVSAHQCLPRPLQGWDLLQPRRSGAVGLVAGLLGHVALVPVGAAVLVVVTADGLRQRAAGPLSRVLLTAGGAAGTHRLSVTLLVRRRGRQGGRLLQPADRRRGAGRVVAGFSLQVADGAVRAAVDVVVTADGLRQGAAGPVSAGRPAARGLPGTRGGLVTLAVVAGQRDGGRFAEPRRHGAARRVVTRGGRQVTNGGVRTAVEVVFTAHGLG